MGSVLSYIEVVLGTLLRSVRGHDSGLLTQSVAFKHISPTIRVTSPLGPSGSSLRREHSQWAPDGTTGAHPSLSWTLPANTPSKSVKEYMLLCEDPDVPIPGFCPYHSIFYHIPADTTSTTSADIEIEKNDKVKGDYTTKSGWSFVPNMRGSQYMGPRPPLGHGMHRYVYTIVALGEELNLQGKKVSKEVIADDCVGKVVAWGSWIGNYENLWAHHQ